MHVQAYSGYAYGGRVYAYGRILKNKQSAQIISSRAFNLLQSFRLFRTKELAKVKISIPGSEYIVYTNSEGFYKLDLPVQNLILNHSIRIQVQDGEDFIDFLHPVHMISPSAPYLVASDIDDTVLKTDVLSRIRMIYNSFFLSAKQRRAIPGMSEWYQAMSRKGIPIVYVSNSPWNFYQRIKQFLQLNSFPDGPLFLRDFGFKAHDDLQVQESHKYNEIDALLKFVEDKQIILIGDSGEHDPKIYQSIQKQYPDRVKGIFIRTVGNVETGFRDGIKYFNLPDEGMSF
jgi:phosphatidate phosphatase APP1